MAKHKIINGDGLTQMFSMQKELLKHYIEIEGLKPYPVDINTKAGQKILKDFSYRFTEELMESYNELVLALEAVEDNNINKAKAHAINYRIEVADWVHFFLEILIYSSMEVDMCQGILENHLSEMNMTEMGSDNTLGTLFKLGNFLNIKFDLNIPKHKEFKIFSKLREGEQEIEPLRRISRDGLEVHGKLQLEIIYRLMMSMNLLKNKDWSLAEKKVNTLQYYEGLMTTVLVLFQYLDFAGFTELTLFNAYVDKNEINHQRILNKY